MITKKAFLKNRFKQKILIILLLLYSISSYSQSKFINYQGVASDNNGNILANQTLDIKIGLKFGFIQSVTRYDEIHSVTTDANGVFNLKIGNGNRLSGNYNDLTWQEKAFVRVSINGTIVGTTELLAVPFALNARPPKYDIGLHAELGGYVVYVTPNGEHGMVAQLEDQWGGPSSFDKGNWYDAQDCHIFNNGSEFIDWVLPDINQFRKLGLNATSIGLSTTERYWISNPFSVNQAFAATVSPNGGASATTRDKTLKFRTRCVRFF